MLEIYLCLFIWVLKLTFILSDKLFFDRASKNST